MKRRQSEFEKTCSECRKAIRPGRWYNSEQEGLTEHVQCDECRDEMEAHGAMTEEEKQEYRLDQQDEAERETEDDSLQGCRESDRIAEGLDAMGKPLPEEIATIKQRAKLFVDDNFSNPTPSDYLIIESAMLIGASIAHEGTQEETKMF